MSFSMTKNVTKSADRKEEINAVDNDSTDTSSVDKNHRQNYQLFECFKQNQ
jgi:hypothetical protein